MANRFSKIAKARFLTATGQPNMPQFSPQFSKNFSLDDTYHWLLSLKWTEFLFFYVVIFTVANLIFAAAYACLGPGALEGVNDPSFILRAEHCFFFSVQTLATIGYGRISPQTLSANLVATLEAMLGLLGMAISTGLIFSRFSRPMAKVVFSSHCLVNKQNGIPCLMFRIGNQRSTKIAEANVALVMIYTEHTLEGEYYRRLVDLKLRRHQTPAFELTWTVIHMLEADSPLYGCTPAMLKEREISFVVTMNGVDEVLSHTIYARHSYVAEDLRWGQRFKDVLKANDEGQLEIDMNHFHETEDLPTA